MTAQKRLLLSIGLIILILGCAGPVAILNNEIIQQYELTENDFKKMTFYTNGQVIFVRLTDSFNGSRRSASNGTLRKPEPGGLFDERVALESNTAGFFHHKTESHLYIQFMAGELVLPFKLDDGKLDVAEIVFDGKQYEYEEGEAGLIFNIKQVSKSK